MKGQHIGFDDEVTPSSAKDVKDTAHLNTEAKERFTTGTNTTARHKHKGTKVGKKGARGLPG